MDLNCAAIQGTGGLLERLAAITDPRAKRGVRHRLVSLLAIAAAAALSGAKSFVAVGEFASELSQEALARLGARRHPVTGRYVAPHEATLRRAIRSVDPDQLDRALGGWLAEQTHPAPATAVTSSCWRSRSTARRCAAPEAPTADRCSCSPRCSTVRARSSPNAKSTTPPTRSPSSARYWTNWTCVARS